MKKIIILAAAILIFSELQAYSACKLENLDACKANLNTGSQTIKDKLVPNQLNQLVNPTRDTSKQFTTTPHTIPETINIDVDNVPNRNESNTPYNAACQFGVCIPGNNTGAGNAGE